MTEDKSNSSSLQFLKNNKTTQEDEIGDKKGSINPLNWTKKTYYNYFQGKIGSISNEGMILIEFQDKVNLTLNQNESISHLNTTVMNISLETNNLLYLYGEANYSELNFTWNVSSL